MGKLTSTIGIPIKLLNEAQVSPPLLCDSSLLLLLTDTSAQGHVVTLEITSGQVYRGKLLEGAFLPTNTLRATSSSKLLLIISLFHTAEDNMNVQLKDITVTARDGRVSHLDQVYIRGSHVRFFIVPDMLRNAPMFRTRGQRGRGVGLARGKATVNRARGQRPRGA
jgi:small nuclear ribonucleoprotein D3